MNKWSFGQRFIPNKHATIRYIFKISFFGVITLLGFVRVSKLLFQQPDEIQLAEKGGHGRLRSFFVAVDI